MGDRSLSRVEWIIHYADGTTFTNLDGAPHEAPRTGVQIVQALDIRVGRMIWRDVDFYTWSGEDWLPRDLLGVMDYLTEPGAEKIVLRGRCITSAQFWRIYNEAIADARLPMKTARDLRELPMLV
jgi:hypothetical protein